MKNFLINGDLNNKKILEITRITRLLLQKIMEVSSLHMNHKTKACFDFIIFHKNFTKLTGIKKNITNINLDKIEINTLLRQTTTIGLPKNYETITTTNESGIKNKIFLDTIEEDIKEKSNDDFNRNKNSNTNNSPFNLYDKENSDENKNNLMINKSDIIPSYIFESLHCIEIPEKGMEEKEKVNKGKNLKILWDDFALYDSIIDYYSSNVWGTEHLRKKVKLDIDTNIISLIKNLLKEYGENKSYRNILIKDILKCFNIKYSEEATKVEKIKINILYINIILLCIAIEITQDYDERVFLEGKFQQFVIFCVLSSININSNSLYY